MTIFWLPVLELANKRLPVCLCILALSRQLVGRKSTNILVSVCKCVRALATADVVYPVAVIDVTVSVAVAAFTMALVCAEFTVVLLPEALATQHTLPILLISLEVPVVLRAIWENITTCAIIFIVLPFSIVDGTAGVAVLTRTLFLAAHDAAPVRAAIRVPKLLDIRHLEWATP